MNTVKKLVLSAAVAATTLAAVPADAGDRWRDNRGYRSHHNSDGDVVAAGILGLALGALAVGAIASSRDEPVVGNPLRHPRPRPHRDWETQDYPQVVVDDDYEPAFEPWSRGWYRYCQQRYRSFDAQTGTYVGYDGRERFCNAG